MSGAARRAPSTSANTAPASTASAARASSPTTACSSRPSRSCAAITATFPSGSSAASTKKRIRLKGDTGAHLIGLLERRLDAVVYRAKFVPTVFAARQFVNHGHIKVNGRRVNIASFRVKVGDTVEVKDKSKQMALVLEARALAERDVPDYIEVDDGKMTAKLTRIPAITDVPYAVMMEPHLVVEYYSR